MLVAVFFCTAVELSMLGFMFKSGASSGDVHRAAEEVGMLTTRRIESLELACAGLWELLKTKHGYSDEELVAAIHKIDMLDGKIDGHARHPDETCPHCGRKLLSRSSPNCSWCGREIERNPIV